MVETIECEFCQKNFSSKSNLSLHKRTAKFCLEKQGKENTTNKCEFCKEVFSHKQRLLTHNEICKARIEITFQRNIAEKDKLIEELRQRNKELEEQLFKLAEKAIEKPTHIIYQSVDEEINHNSDIIIHEKSTNDDIQEYKFGNNFIVPIRSDGMINATALCKAAGKRLDHYKENLQTKDYLNELSSVTGIPVSELFNPIIGGKYPGTWVHRKVGYHLAQWISPKFAVQVSLILDELFITGKVELYNEKSTNEIDTEYKRQITDLKTKLDTNTEQYQKLLIKHNSSLKTHRYIKFKKTDPCFYIIDSGIECDCLCYKFGITGLDQGNNIDDRLRCHRTLWPQLKVRYLLFVKDVEMIEKSFKMMFEKEINPNGHEIIEGVSFDVMIKRIEKLFDILCIKEYHIIPEDKLKEYNDYVDTTIKVI